MVTEKILILKTSFYLVSGVAQMNCLILELLDNGLYLRHGNEWHAMTDLVCSQSNCTKPLRVTVN